MKSDELKNERCQTYPENEKVQKIWRKKRKQK